jgi:uncharacterized protein (TIGR00290 family)
MERKKHAMKERVLVCWSGGKDSALALRETMASNHYEVAALLTTVTSGYDRISMHGVRCSLLVEQAAAMGLPLRQVTIPPAASNEIYEANMKAAFLDYKREGITSVVFGDLFLEDIRKYRDRMLAEIGLTALYPVWGKNTAQLARDFIGMGFQAVLVCVDPKQLDEKFAGRFFDQALLADLPPTADPCGENGEFHTFVFAGPTFKRPMKVEKGEVVMRSSFCFCDLLPVAADAV